ncbi:MAG: hypothetical protein ABFC63_02155 [Thermoguttaceae bacterium]
MRAKEIGWIGAALLWAAVALGAEQSMPAADRVGQVLGRVGRMNRDEQQAWLRRLEKREARAARITLKPNEAAKDIADFRGLLHRKLVTWPVLREAVEKTDAREQEAIKQLGQRYRTQVFTTLSAQLDEYGRWQEAWSVVLQSWKTSGSPFEQQDRLIDWLEAAIRSVSAKTPGVVPRRPEFQVAAVGLPPPEPSKTAKAVRTVRKPEIEGHARGDSPQVNIEELTSRIAGFNLALRAIEADLDEKGTWSAARLEPVVERLKILVVRRNDLDLFRDLTPADKRSELAKLDSPKAAMAQLGARIFAARTHTSGPQFQGTNAERRTESEQLETLSRRLAEMAGK